MHWLLTGREVHVAETTNEVLLAAMSSEPKPIRETNSSVPEVIAEIVDRALRSDREERWPSAASMRSAVRNAYRTHTGRSIDKAPPLITPAKPEPPPIRPRWPSEVEEETLVAPRARPHTSSLQPTDVVRRRPRSSWLLATALAATVASASVDAPEPQESVNEPHTADAVATEAASSAADTAPSASTRPPPPLRRVRPQPLRPAAPAPQPTPKPRPKGWLDRFE
jgi:serine/threonine-protein kinase